MNTENNAYQKSAIGSDDFKDLIASGQYVDKSLFIKDVITDAFKVPLITRPRRWGKSSNMSMLKTFLEIEVDEHGNELPEEKKVNPVYFTGGAIQEDDEIVQLLPLKISADAKAMKKIGKYPVILMSFKDLGGASYEELVEDLKIKLIEVFESYQYLSVSDKLSSSEKARINKHLVGDFSVAFIKNAIKFLTKCIYKHFGKKVWILIDEYDNAIHRAYTAFGPNGKNPRQFSAEFKKVLDLFRDLMSAAYKGNDYLERGLITGILRIAQANLFSGLSNVKEYGVLHQRFASYYGFTREEVGDLCDLYQLPAYKKEKLKNWYNGYTYGGLELYNPWSIMNYMEDQGEYLVTYWEDTSYGALQNLQINQTVFEELQTLLSSTKEEIAITIGEGLNLNTLSLAETRSIKTLLLLAGYFNPLQQLDAETYTVNIPNEEVRIALSRLIRKWIANAMQVDQSNFDPIILALKAGNVSDFKASLSAFIQSALSFKIMHEKKQAIKLKESHYHFLMIGLLNGLFTMYNVKHELESGDGYVDTMIVPKSLFCNKEQAIILEYKYAKEESKLKSVAEAALKQIKKKNYIATIVGEKHIRSVLQLGISFHQKEVEVVNEIVYLNHS